MERGLWKDKSWDKSRITDRQTLRQGADLFLVVNHLVSQPNHFFQINLSPLLLML